VLSGLVVAAITHPSWGAHDYEAVHKLYSPAAGRSATANGQPGTLVDPFLLKPDAIAALATSRQTATRVAADLGYDGEPLRIMQRVRATADANAGTIAISSRRRNDAQGAVVIADTVAKELITLVDESRTAAREKAIDEARSQANGIQDTISSLTATDSATKARRDELTRQYTASLAEVDRLVQSADTSGISTIQPAIAERLPSHAVEALSPLFGWLLTLLLLLGLGAGLAVAVDLTDDRLADHLAAEAATGLPVLMIVPSEDDDGIATATAYRKLERAVAGRRGPTVASAAPSSFVVPKVSTGGRVVLFTSPAADGDRAATVIGFAQAVAATGRTSLIVDCSDGDDDEPGDQRGLGDVATAGVVLQSLLSLVQPTSMPRVSLVPRGQPHAAVGEFLVHHDHLVRSATTLADVVILHGPALNAGGAAAGLAQLADDTVVVCRAGSTRVADARQAAVALYDAGASAGLAVVGETPSAEPISLTPADVIARVRGDEKLRGRLEWAGAAAAMLVLYVFMRAFVFQSFSIPTPSMAPYLNPGDRVLVTPLGYRLHSVRRGDVIVFKTPAKARALGGNRLIKRVIALPGETVESRDGKLYVNGKQLAEKYLPPATVTENVAKQTIPKGRYWVMGDNRGNSADSRFFGTIPRGSIVGRAFFHLWPTPIGLM